MWPGNRHPHLPDRTKQGAAEDVHSSVVPTIVTYRNESIGLAQVREGGVLGEHARTPPFIQVFFKTKASARFNRSNASRSPCVAPCLTHVSM